MKSVIGAVIFLVVVLFVVEKRVDALCCYSCVIQTQHGVLVDHCRDCSRGTPYCGKGDCNMFGCNCDGACREGNCQCIGKRSADSSADHLDSIFQFADHDNDGQLDVSETRKWLQRNKRELAAKASHHFQKMDVNGDGFLTRQEIDP